MSPKATPPAPVLHPLWQVILDIFGDEWAAEIVAQLRETTPPDTKEEERA